MATTFTLNNLKSVYQNNKILMRSLFEYVESKGYTLALSWESGDYLERYYCVSTSKIGKYCEDDESNDNDNDNILWIMEEKVQVLDSDARIELLRKGIKLLGR